MNLFLLILAFILLCALYISINIELFRKKDKEDTRRSSYQQNEEDELFHHLLMTIFLLKIKI